MHPPERGDTLRDAVRQYGCNSRSISSSGSGMPCPTPLEHSYLHAPTQQTHADTARGPYLLRKADAARVLVKDEQALRAEARVVGVVALRAHIQRAALRHAKACMDAVVTKVQPLVWSFGYIA